MITFILVIHIIVSVFLVLIVLIQSAKGGGLGGAFGGITETTFGTQTGTFLTRFTTTLAILFMITSLTLAVFSSKRKVSIMEEVPAQEETIPEKEIPESK